MGGTWPDTFCQGGGEGTGGGRACWNSQQRLSRYSDKMELLFASTSSVLDVAAVLEPLPAVHANTNPGLAVSLCDNVETEKIKASCFDCLEGEKALQLVCGTIQ